MKNLQNSVQLLRYLPALLAFGVSVQSATLRAQSDIDLTGYTLNFAEEFTNLSTTATSPKGSYTWYSGYPPNGKSGVFGFARRDVTCMSINNGILENKLRLETVLDKAGAFCGGPVGMKNSAGTAMVNVGTLGTQVRDHSSWQWYGWAGMKFTVGASAVTISQLGRYAISSNTQTHQVRIFSASTGADVAKAIVNCAGKTGFVYANIVGGNVTLAANTSYYLLTDNYNSTTPAPGADFLYSGANTTVTATGGITINESRSGGWRVGTLYSADSTGAGFAQQNGYFEMKAKMPSSGMGAWPSFWLKTINDITGPSGLVEEIDIFEWYGGRYSATPQVATMQQASHNWGGTNPPPALLSPATPMPGGAFPWAGYHIYGFKSDPVNCTWYIDGVQTNQIPTPTAYLANPMYIIVNYAIGGGWPLEGVVSNSKLEIDWIRVYSLPSGGGSSTLLSTNKPVTVSSTHPGYPGSYAVDGIASTRWSSSFSDPQWIYVDLGTTRTITRVLLNWETAAGRDYTIQTAAATAGPWTTIKTVTGNTTPGAKDYTGLSGSGRYVRMSGTARTTTYGYSLWAFDVYGN